MSFNFTEKGNKTYRSWKKWTEGDVLIGKFLSQYEDNYGNPGYDVQVIECDFSEEGDILEEGKIIGINSCGGLNYKMEEVPLGSVIRVEYDGTDFMDKGPMKGKEFHKVNLGVDESTANSTQKVEKQVEESSEENFDL